MFVEWVCIKELTYEFMNILMDFNGSGDQDQVLIQISIIFTKNGKLKIKKEFNKIVQNY